MDKYWDIIKNEAGETTGTILIYGDIGGYDWDTWEVINTAKKFRSEFKELEKDHEVIEVHINSNGGSVTEGLAISNIISQSTSEVHTYVDGAAFSMGAMIALSGHKVHMAPNSILMVHNAWTFAWGNAKDLRKEAENLDTFDRSLALMISNKTGKTEEEVFAEFLDGEDHFMNADEALEYGLIDHVEEDKVEDEVVEAALALVKNIKPNQYNKIAASLIPRPKNTPTEKEWRKAVLGISAKKQTTPQTDKMNFEKLLNHIENGKFNEVLNADEISAIKEEINATLKNGDVVTPSDLKAVNDKLDSANKAINAIGEELEIEEGSDVLSAVKTLKTKESQAQAKLAELAPPAPVAEGDDPLKKDKDPADDFAHNKAADEKLNSRRL